jgi:hypothetical protein
MAPNINPNTGIAYGIISANSLRPEIVDDTGMENEFEAAKFHTTRDAYRFIDEQRDEGDNTAYDVMRLTVDGILTTEF